MTMSSDQYEDFRGYCRAMTDKQIPAVFWKETENERPAMAAIAKAECIGRGLPDPSHERVEWREDNERF